jgi:AraC family transcriptional regulator, transcriptional activator of pobA
MDGPPNGWYFPTMGSRHGRAGARDAPLAVTFNRTKYGRELLVDAAFVAKLQTFERTQRPHRLDFFDILLVTRGRGEFFLDERVYPIKPGIVFLSRPGEVRRWNVPRLDGAVLFFAPAFFTDAFSDPHFLDQFACFQPNRRSSAVALNSRDRRLFLTRFHEMEREIQAPSVDEPHALRALTYQVLVLLNRAYVRAYGADADVRDSVVAQYQSLVEQRFARTHYVADYARALGVTPRQLNDRCRAAKTLSASAIVHERVTVEARRLLLYTDLPVARIGASLGFEDPAYFARFFRRETGLSPTAFRLAGPAQSAG